MEISARAACSAWRNIGLFNSSLNVKCSTILTISRVYSSYFVKFIEYTYYDTFVDYILEKQIS